MNISGGYFPEWHIVVSPSSSLKMKKEICNRVMELVGLVGILIDEIIFKYEELFL